MVNGHCVAPWSLPHLLMTNSATMSFARRASEQRAAEAQRLRLQAEVAALQQDLQGTRMALRDSEAREASLQQALERCVLGRV